MEKTERHISTNLNSLMMLIKAMVIANLLLIKLEKMFQIMKLGEQVFTPSLEITLLQLEVLYKLQKKLELNSTMPSVFS